MKRIVIIGPGGAGKSTLAKQIGEIFNIEVLHLDKLYWQSGWVEPSADEWGKKVEELLKANSWVMDGNFGGTMEMRLKACDTAIFMDFPPAICLYRVLKRRLKYRNTNRPDMTEGCNEKVDLDFLGWIWNYRKVKKPKVEKILQKFERNKKIIRLKSPKDVEKFISNVKEMK
ncbi:MAG: DNA topology modulation protein [Acidobacteriota bacterium]